MRGSAAGVAVQMTSCGGGCADDVIAGEAVLDDVSAGVAVLGGAPWGEGVWGPVGQGWSGTKVRSDRIVTSTDVSFKATQESFNL